MKQEECQSVPAGDKGLGFRVLGDKEGRIVEENVGHVERAIEGSLVAVGDEVGLIDGAEVG